MARAAKGLEALEAAKEAVAKTKCARELRIAQAVGRSARWATKARDASTRHGGLPQKPPAPMGRARMAQAGLDKRHVAAGVQAQEGFKKLPEKLQEASESWGRQDPAKLMFQGGAASATVHCPLQNRPTNAEGQKRLKQYAVALGAGGGIMYLRCFSGCL